MKSYDENYVKQYLLDNGNYKMLSEYVDDNEKFLIEHDGYKSYIVFNRFLNGSRPRFFSIHSGYQKENIALFFERNFPGVQFVDARQIKKSGKTRILVKFICSCGKPHEKTWEHIYREDAKCYECGRENHRRNRKKGYTAKYRKNIEKAGYQLVNPKQELYAGTLVEVIEKDTGYRGFLYPNRANELKKILVFSLYTNKSNLVYNMNKYAENTGNPSKVIRLIDPEEKITEYTQIVECKCGKCGKIYQTKYRAFMKSKWLCDDCSAKESKNERLVAQFLQDNNINFISEFVINSCNDIRPLPFDFCLTDYNILVEVDGEQHFSPVRYGGMPQEQAEKIFEYTKKHDKIKNEYCVKFNVPLLRISYKEINNETYKHKILNFIQTARD